MKFLLAAIITATMWLGAAHAADFDKGLSAAKSGDFATALREWTPLAEQGHAKAQFNLGVMYDRGQGVTQDYAEASKWYRKTAEQGDAAAQDKLRHLTLCWISQKGTCRVIVLLSFFTP